MKRYNVQLLDRQSGKWWTWEFAMTHEAAKAQAAHARERGEVSCVKPFSEDVTIEDLI